MNVNQDIPQAISQLLDRLKEAEDNLTRTPTAFRWTPAMSAVFPVRLTMSQLTAMWEALHDAAEYSVIGASDGVWTKWDGGEYPVEENVLIDVRLRNGLVQEKYCGAKWWINDGNWYNITHWRLTR